MADEPSKPSLVSRMTPRAGARQVMGIILLLTVVAVAVAALVLGVERSRASYFEQRNLRELDRVAANIGSTTQTLGSVASLYFNPRQLHFSLTPATECLMASTRVQRTADLAIDINYYFVDAGAAPPGEVKGETEGKTAPAAGAAAGGAKTAAAPQAVTAAPAPGKTEEAARAETARARTTLCPYDPDGDPLRPATGETLTIDGERIRMGEWLLLRDLLRPMTAGGAGADPAATARGVLQSEAARRLERGGFGPGAGDAAPAVVSRSLATAFARNAVRTEVSVSIAALDLDTSLETFDAIQIIGAGDGSAPALLFQAGQLPPAITGSDGGASRDFLKNILKAGDQAADAAMPAKSQRSYQESEGGGSLLMESKVYPAGDLMIFDKRYASLGGFACSAAKPCRIIGIIKDKRFGSEVRKFEGMHSTFFLIAVLTLVGLVPMIHLALRKRLDAVGRRAQYVMWFSLTLLAASALIASLTVWAAAISKSESTAYTAREIERLKAGFAAELNASLRLITQLGKRLEPSLASFPAPAQVRWTRGIPEAGRDAALLDTTGYFRGDGYAARDIARFSDVRTAPYGTNIADRGYFLRLRNGDHETIPFDARLCKGGKLDFVIDRVVARPDGVAKTVFALPAKEGCVDPPGRGTGPAADEDQARPQLLLASGYLQTFMAASVHPGFQYAVIDPNRPEGEPDILFSNRRSAELAEVFERDLDDPAGFRTRMEQFELNEDKGRVRWLATHYRGDPVRLTMTRLHPNVDWVLVVIEGRNDSGFAIWRAATFGYSTWLFAIVAVVLIMLIARLWNHKALDRRPGLWLWPVDVMTDFTPPRFAFEEERRAELKAAAIRRDLYLRRIFFAGAVGVIAAEGASRTLLALALVMAAFAGRAYFKGKTASDKPAARKLDRIFLYSAAILILLSIAIFAWMTWVTPAAGDSLAGQVPRILLFLGALLFLVEPLGEALGAAAEEGTKSERFAARFDSGLPAPLKRRRRKAEAPEEDRKTRLGWMYFLLAIGALPAAGGFLDSIDHDSALVAERTAQRSAATADTRRKMLESVEAGRLGRNAPNDVETALLARIAEGRVPGEKAEGEAGPGGGASKAKSAKTKPQAKAVKAKSGPDKGPAGAKAAKAKDKAAGPPKARRPWDVTVADLSMRSLDLHEMALSFSDFRAWHMRDGFGAARRAPIPNAVAGLLAMLLPFLILYGALLLFRRQYFTKPPRTPAIDPKDFSPPLTAPRDQFLERLLVPAASGGRPALPFDRDPSHRHLILGVDLDIASEPAVAALGGRIEWIDLLDIADGKAEAPASFKGEVRAVVIGNLDIALQLPDRAQVKKVFEAVEKLIEAAGKSVDAKGRTRRRERHVFLLSDVVPLDRIALLRDREAKEDAPTKIEDWRWAALLQDFTLVAVVPTSPLAGAGRRRLPSCAERELLVINTVFARALLAQLRASGKADAPDDYEDRVIDYVAEQMADYYHKLWAASSDEERVLLYHIAWRCHLKMTEGPAVRSLLVRGLIVRSPEYRLMNKSFARYVRRIERLERIRKRAADAGGIDKIWPLIRVPLMVFTLALLVIVQLISPRHATGALGIVPALGAIVPAMLANWLRLKAAEG